MSSSSSTTTSKMNQRDDKDIFAFWEALILAQERALINHGTSESDLGSPNLAVTAPVSSSPFLIDKLPNELLMTIGSHLKREDILNLRLVSPRLRDFYGSFYTFILKIGDKNGEGSVEQVNNFLQREAVPVLPGFTLIVKTTNKYKLSNLLESPKITKLIIESPILLQKTAILSKLPKLEELWIKNFESSLTGRLGSSGPTLRNSMNHNNIPVFSQLKRIQLTEPKAYHNTNDKSSKHTINTIGKQNTIDFKFCALATNLELLKIYTLRSPQSSALANLHLIPTSLTTLWLCTSFQIGRFGLEKILTRCTELKELMLQYQQFNKTVTPALLERILWNTHIKKLTVTPVSEWHFKHTMEPIIIEAQGNGDGRIERIRKHFRHNVVTIKIERN